MNNNTKRNIYRANGDGRWCITKYKDGKFYRFGNYDKLEDAMLIRDMLERINYGFSDLDPMRNIQYNKNRSNSRPYYLRKFRDGEFIYTGSFATLEEAQEERDLMESVDWDFEATNGAGDMTEEELKYGQMRYGGKFR